MRTITYSITDLLKLARTGAYTVPLFQREFVWREAQEKLLIDSVSRNFPIGSLLVLAESASQMPHLAARLIDAIVRMWESGDDEAIGPIDGARTDRMYVLDGQQRLTSLVRVFLDAGQEKSYNDFLTGTPLNPRVAEDHHIYPASLARSQGFARRRLDAITNRLFVSADTNRALTDRPPSEYMAEVAAAARKLRIEGSYDQRLREAALPGNVGELRFADRYALAAFETFQRERARAILGLVRTVIGDALQDRPVNGRMADDPEDLAEEDDG